MAWDELAISETVEKTIGVLGGRGVDAEIVDSRQEALERLKQILPFGAEIMTAGSVTLKEIGFVDLLKSGRHPWKNLKDAILAENDQAKQRDIRRRSTLADYYLGSVHAVTQTGEVVVASATGSQLAGYVYSAKSLVWVVGTQKIVSNLEEGLRRVREYCLPLEDKRVRDTGGPGSTIGKVLIFERETNPNRKIKLIFVKEKLGV